MKNEDVQNLLSTCREELSTISALLYALGPAATPSPYVKKYAVIRATGSIEASFKQIIADKVDQGSHDQLKNFIARKVRNSSTNPKLEAIQNLLTDFDDRWRARFDEKLALSDRPKLKEALTQLVKARNSFAHGGVEELPIETTVEYFECACDVIRILDETVNDTYD